MSRWFGDKKRSNICLMRCNLRKEHVAMKQLTTLDILIIIALRESVNPIIMDKQSFTRYTRFVRAKNGFIIHEDPIEKQVIICPYGQVVELYLKRLLELYEQDELLPFEKYGFSDVRLSEHSRFLTDVFFERIPITWDLNTNSCRVGKRYVHNHARALALDLFATQEICVKEVHVEFTSQLTQDTASGCFLFCANTPNTRHSKARNPRMASAAALACRVSRKVCCGKNNELVMTSSSNWALLHQHPIKFGKSTNSKAHRLLWLCVTTEDTGRFIPIPTAYSYVQNGRRYVAPARLDDNLAHWDPLQKADNKKKLDVICNARDLINRKLLHAETQWNIQVSIRIFAGIHGTKLIYK